SNSKKQEVMAAVRQEIQMANAQELMNKMNERCFDRCVTKPGTKLENGEQVCISRCMDRYMEAWNIVARAYTQDFQR
ncbi:Tim10/DDP family zinc finger protein, partial [Piptocephalis cylindrospora]